MFSREDWGRGSSLRDAYFCFRYRLSPLSSLYISLKWAFSKYSVSKQKYLAFSLQKQPVTSPAARPKIMLIPKEQASPAICSPPCFRKLVPTGMRKFPLEYMAAMFWSNPELQEAQTMALQMQPMTPGIPCRLWIPQVSQRPIQSSSLGLRLWKQRALTDPPMTPMKRANPGRQMKVLGAPTMIPPAMVALRMFSISRPLPKPSELTMNVPRTLPARDITVLTTIRFCSNAFWAVTAQLKEGKQSTRKSVPMNAKILFTQLILMSVIGLAFLESTIQTVSPKQHPKVWTVELAPASIIPILTKTIYSLREQPITLNMAMMRRSLGPTLPITPPKATSIAATASEHRINVVMSQVKVTDTPCQSFPKTLAQKPQRRGQA